MDWDSLSFFPLLANVLYTCIYAFLYLLYMYTCRTPHRREARFCICMYIGATFKLNLFPELDLEHDDDVVTSGGGESERER